MVDQEVVDILAEIRQRVASAQANGPASEARPQVSPQSAPPDSVLAKRTFASLSVLDRAWNRLPPLVSKRTGTSARFELWVKSKLKLALRWLTWKQINFNAATRQTFIELIEALAAYEQQMELRHNELTAMRDEFLREMTGQQSELNTQRSLLRRHQTDLNERFESLESTVKDFQSQTAREAQSRFDDLAKEFRERDERLLDEQR